MKARYAPHTHADRARELLTTARALMRCLGGSLPVEGAIEPDDATQWQTAMSALCEVLDEGALHYAEAPKLTVRAEMAATHAQGMARCIAGTLWNLVNADLPGPLAATDLAAATRHVECLLQQAIGALPQGDSAGNAT